MEDEEEDRDTYVTQLKEVFISCDSTESGCLNESELKLLCKKLHLDDHKEYFIYHLLEKVESVEVTFEDFKNCFVALLSESVPSEEVNDENDDLLEVEEVVADREVSPKFILGQKQYGRRSKPAGEKEGELSADEQSDKGSLEDLSSCGTQHPQKCDVSSVKRPVSPSYPQQLPLKSGRMITTESHPTSPFSEMSQVHQDVSYSDSDSKSSSVENNVVEYLQKTWNKLGIGNDGFLTVEELALVCEHTGMDMTEEVICQLFEKLDCDQDGRISFDEFVQGLFQHGDHQNLDALTIDDNKKTLSQPYTESSRDEQLSNTSISGLFSCLDSDNKGYANGTTILELWESLEIPFALQAFEKMGYHPRQSVNLSDLTSHLEEEMLRQLKSRVGQLGFISFQSELNYVRQCNEQLKEERNKLRENLEEANARAALLAQEVDDNHAKLEKALHDKLQLAEKKHHDQVRDLIEDLQQERDALTLQTNKFKQKMQSEIQAVRDEETLLKTQLQQLEQENARLETELQETAEKFQEAEKQKEMLQKELASLPSLKKRLADLESHQGEIQEYQHQALRSEIENYKRINQELQDKIDELSTELESIQQQGSFQPDAVSSNGGVSRAHSWLSDYKKATLIGFKRRGSDSSSEGNSDDECPTIGKVRRTYFEQEGSSLDNSLEPELGEDNVKDSQSQKSKPNQPTAVDVLLRDMFVDQEQLMQKLCVAEEQKEKAQFVNAQLRNKCKILTQLAYDATKVAIA